MNLGPRRSWRRVRFREDECPTFGKVRPVHLDEISALERRLRVENDRAVATTRLGWRGGDERSLPVVGSFLSLHMADGKYLLAVDRVVRSCACCRERGMWFVVASDVEEALPQVAVCDCARRREWATSVQWGEAPEFGMCRRAGSDALANISDAIRAKMAILAEGGKGKRRR